MNDEVEVRTKLSCPNCDFNDQATFEYLYAHDTLYMEFTCPGCNYRQNNKFKIENGMVKVQEGGTLTKKMLKVVERR